MPHTSREKRRLRRDHRLHAAKCRVFSPERAAVWLKRARNG